MLISKEWLSDFVDLAGRRDEDIAKIFTLRTAEVEGIVREGETLDKICVGVIGEIGPHPKADRLRICLVDVGEHVPLQIVCGGSNLEIGQKVTLARIGARVQWHGEGELITLEPAEIRGIKSDGMICGADEIGLAADFPKGGEKEVLDLSHLKAKAGTPLAQALGKNGVLFELDNKALSNRPDLWGLRGLAREFGAVLDAKVSLPAAKTVKGKSDVALDVSVEDGALCPRYQAVVLNGVAATPSPAWMQKRLIVSGVRPINALVDVTNYVMLETGQPLHAFDFNSAGGKIVVRKAHAGEKINALDGKTYDIPAGGLVVATKNDVIAVAGVIGGVEHAVSDATTSVVIESANFSGSSVRQTSTRMRVRTESSSRFEKGLDANNTELGLARAVELLLQIFPAARVVSKVVDQKKALPKPGSLDVTQDDITRAIGEGITLSAAKKILGQLGFVCKGDAKKIRVTVPTFRLKDIKGVHDIVEEIVRLVGYEKIPSALFAIALRNIEELPVVREQYRIKELCAFRHGLTEVNTYAYVRPQTAALFGYASEGLIELANPLSSERPYLAPTLVMNLAEVVEKNQRMQNRVAIFEIAKVFSHDVQPTKLGIAFSEKHAKQNFAQVREMVIRVLQNFGYEASVALPQSFEGWWKKGSAGSVVVGDCVVGCIAILDPTIQNEMGIEHETVLAEIDLTRLFSQKSLSKKYSSAPVFQGSVRDVAFTVDETMHLAAITHAILDAHPLVRNVELFDIFRGPQLGEGKKAPALHVLYRSDDHTLSGEELAIAHAAVINALESKCSATIR
jgi:phenylalanyl-tRNA synthetase beta chain